jgi:hypothetical protein
MEREDLVHRHSMAARAINVHVKRDAVKSVIQPANGLLEKRRLRVAHAPPVLRIFQVFDEVHRVPAQERPPCIVPEPTPIDNVHPELITPGDLVRSRIGPARHMQHFNPSKIGNATRQPLHDIYAVELKGRPSGIDKSIIGNEAHACVAAIVHPEHVHENPFVHAL